MSKQLENKNTLRDIMAHYNIKQREWVKKKIPRKKKAKILFAFHAKIIF